LRLCLCSVALLPLATLPYLPDPALSLPAALADAIARISTLTHHQPSPANPCTCLCPIAASPLLQGSTRATHPTPHYTAPHLTSPLAHQSVRLWSFHNHEGTPHDLSRTSRADLSQYLPVQDFEAVTSALNYNTPDCHVTGGCDLYTTKSTGSDKKLYKSIDKDLSSQHAALIKLGASLSPPDRQHMLATSHSMQLFSRSSAFGPLSELSSRRTFAYLIATLNASHPHYDFSHVLRPGDFSRQKNLRNVMVNLDSILQNVRPGFEAKSYSSSLGSDSNSVWGPHCWSLIDKEMRLNECTIFSYNPDVDPFEEDESAIWAVHYFFFNRALKRVAYLYVRVVPVISSQSPTLRPMQVSHNKRQTEHDSGASKRARYWLGDRDAELVLPEEDEDGLNDSGLYWNRGDDGDLVLFSDDDYYEEDEELDDDVPHKPHDRLMSEDIAGRMEI
jgi:AP-1 complex subunit sigma 1/2